jgi:hypothetical protein
MKRPASGDLCLMMVDALGAAAAVEFTGSQRRVLRADAGAGALVAGDRDVRRTETLAADEACTQLDDWLVCVDPSLRRLRVRSRSGGPESVFPVAAG